MIAATAIVLATVGGHGAATARPRVGWLSGGPRQEVLAVAKGLDVELSLVDVGDHTVAPEIDADWDLVTADGSALGRHGGWSPESGHLERLARRTGARCPNLEAIGLAADPVASRAALAAAGFPVVRGDAGPSPVATVAVARRPSGWCRPVSVDRPDPVGRRGLELAAAIAAGLDVAGVLHLDLVAPDGREVRVDRLRVGPDPDDRAAVEAHLRGLLDLPLEPVRVGNDR